MYHDQDMQPMRCLDSDKPLLLGLGMLGIGDRERQWIGKDRRRLLERYGVFPGVRETFLGIPCEHNAHVSSVAAVSCIAVEETG